MSRLILVSAGRDSGKTTALWKLYREYQAESSNRTGGYISALNEENDKSRIVLQELHTGERLLLASSLKDDWKGQEEHCFKMGRRYTFSQSVFDHCEKSIQKILNYSHIFIDEAGALELKDKGFSSSIKILNQRYSGTLVIAVRDLFLEDFQRTFPFNQSWTTQVLGI